jgi:hypothetical protein
MIMRVEHRSKNEDFHFYQKTSYFSPEALRSILPSRISSWVHLDHGRSSQRFHIEDNGACFRATKYLVDANYGTT